VDVLNFIQLIETIKRNINIAIRGITQFSEIAEHHKVLNGPSGIYTRSNHLLQYAEAILSKGVYDG
jgi:hypothetical protein